MRVLGVSAALVLSLSVGGLTVGVGSGLALADDHGTPSKQDVRDARADAVHAADDVAGVQAQLAVANQRLQESTIAAAEASEAYNGARWKAAQARKAAPQRLSIGPRSPRPTCSASVTTTAARSSAPTSSLPA